MIISGTIVTFMVTVLTGEVKGQGCEPYLQFGSDHTMCYYNEKACEGKTLRRSGRLTCQEKQEAVHIHNLLRQQIANGKIKGLPRSQNMAEMVWDDELAAIAQRWADQCNSGHDMNRDVGRFSVGQNSASKTLSKISNDLSANFTFAVLKWFDEIQQKGFNTDVISSYKSVKNFGHFTQVIWATSYALGCGFTVFDDNGKTKKLYVCNYGPRGNMDGEAIYIKGLPNCEAFNSLSSSSRYEGLCEVKNSNPPNTGCGVEAEASWMWYQPEETMTILPFPYIPWEPQNPYRIALPSNNPIIF